MINEKVKQFFEEHQIDRKSKRFLIANSAGPDSMVLTFVLLNFGCQIELAHLNYGLRGKESQADEAFINEFALTNNLILHLKRVNTKDEMLEHESIQMAARRIRYSYFEELMQKQNIDYCVTAHHLDDNIETFFLNLIRGTGIKGLKGINAFSTKLIRPLIAIPKSELLSYAFEHNIEFRTDQTNLESIYQRNILRNEVLPALHKHFPAFRIKMAETFNYMKDALILQNEAIESWKTIYVSISKSITYIEKKALIKHPAGQTILIQILNDFGFSPTVTGDIYKNLTSNTGAAFNSGAYTLLINRDKLEISKGFQQFSTQYFKPETFFDIYIAEEKPEFIDNPPKNLCILDADKISGEIIVRTWKKGDYFHPTGMKGRKKLSDFYQNIKLSRIEKEKQLLLCFGENIGWVVNQRIDRYFTPDQHTLRYAIFRLKSN